MDTSAQSLRIAILGAGKIGSAFAFQLARIGHHSVTVIGRPASARLEQLRRDGAIVNTKGDRAEVEVVSNLDEQTPYDLVIVTLLAHQVDAVLPALQRSAARCIQFMFNTFEPERLREAVGSERCAFGMPFVQAMIDSDGKLKATIGAGGQKTIMSRQSWVDVFNAAGLPAALEVNMPLWLRCHAPLCVAFESVSVAGGRRNGGATWAEAMTLGRGVQACFQLIEALGDPIYPRGKRLLQHSSAAGVAAVLWSVSRVRSFRELLATGKVECENLVDIMTAAASSTAPGVAAKIAAMKL
jgi:2-dehydropantoate 2-reductase